MENNLIQDVYKAQLVENCVNYAKRGALDAVISDINEMLSFYLSETESRNGHLGLNTDEFSEITGIVARVTGLVNFLTDSGLYIKNMREAHESN